MHSRAVRIKKVGILTIAPLRPGDTATVAAVFDRLGTGSRAPHFNSLKPRLSYPEVTELATVDSRRHALVGHVAGDPQPAALARLVRDPHRWAHGEIELAVADCYGGRHIGSALIELLVSDARAAGIRHLTVPPQLAGAPVCPVVHEASFEPRTRAGRTNPGAAAASADSSASRHRTARASQAR